MNYGYEDPSFNDCPFCGSAPRIIRIGNDATKKRKVMVSCPKCRIERTDAAINHGFDWIMDVARKNWNQAPIKKP